MKNTFRNIVGVVFVGLIAANMFVFTNGVKLSDEINFYERELKALRNENVDLEKKVYKVDSITNAASLAAELDFSNKSEPVYIGQKGYAYNQ